MLRETVAALNTMAPWPANGFANEPSALLDSRGATCRHGAARFTVFTSEMIAMSPPPAPPPFQGVDLIAPVNLRNGYAFVSGYLGLGSLFGFGLLLGIPAIVTGVVALRRPELGGRGRAIAGIVMGMLGTVGWTLLLGVLFLYVLADGARTR